MRKILKSLRPLALVGIGFAIAFLVLSGMRAFQAQHIVSSSIGEDSPISELATRKIVWKIFAVDQTVSRDSIRDTTYVLKIGYDLTAIDKAKLRINHSDRKVTLTLPPPKLIAIDDTLQRTVVETKTFFERVFGANVDAGEAERRDLRQLADDCEKFGLLSFESIRESIVTYLATRLQDTCDYTLQVEDDDREISATAIFNAYFAEKGVDFRL